MVWLKQADGLELGKLPGGLPAKPPMGMPGKPPALTGKPPMGAPGKAPATPESIKSGLTELIQKEKAAGAENVKSLEEALKKVEEFIKDKGSDKGEKKIPNCCGIR